MLAFQIQTRVLMRLEWPVVGGQLPPVVVLRWVLCGENAQRGAVGCAACFLVGMFGVLAMPWAQLICVDGCSSGWHGLFSSKRRPPLAFCSSDHVTQQGYCLVCVWAVQGPQ